MPVCHRPAPLFCHSPARQLGCGFSCHAALDAASWAALCGVLHRRAVSTTGAAARKVSTMRRCAENPARTLQSAG